MKVCKQCKMELTGRQRFYCSDKCGKAYRSTSKPIESSTCKVGRNPDEGFSVHIRWMIRRDMQEVLEIERNSFEFPWQEEDFIRCLRQRNCIGMVAEFDEKVHGFMIYELHKNQLHVLNFAVDPKSRKMGVGRQMVEKLKSKLSEQRRNRILFEVRETNLAAQVAFRKLGFKAVSVLKDYYDDTAEDAYVMQYRVAPEHSGDSAGVNRISKMTK